MDDHPSSGLPVLQSQISSTCKLASDVGSQSIWEVSSFR